MPKRRYESDKEEKWLRKLKKYEEKLTRKRRRHCELSSEDNQEYPDESPPALSWDSISPTRSLASIVSKVETRHSVPSSVPSVAVANPIEPQVTFGSAETCALVEPPVASELTEANNVPTADPELLLALGAFEAETNEWGGDISDDLAKRWGPILREGLKNEVKEDLMKKGLFPKNCPLVKPPVLNLEISAMLNESARNRDARIVKKQSQLACALTVLGRTMSDMLTKSIEMPAILKNLSDAAKVIADSHYLETETRRSLVTPMVDKTFIEPFKDRKRDSHLFGEKLGDFIKSSRGIQKTGKLIQSSVSGTNNLNSKPSPSRGQTNYRGSREQNRGGGARAPATTYRRRLTAYQPMSTRGRRASTPPPVTSQRHKPAGPIKQKQ